jgi:hypothetical protein
MQSQDQVGEQQVGVPGHLPYSLRMTGGWPVDSSTARQ